MTDPFDQYRTGGALDAAAAILDRQEESLIGRDIGGYVLIELLGRGGMGVVYRARKSDGHLERDVAVKLLPGGPAGWRLGERFAREAEIHSRLTHPNITRLYDAGVTDTGWPFLVMELISGEPIDQWCESRGLSTAERVTLIRDVARGLSSAHANLVLHRDIKPSNVLIDQDGKPKLLDFGIARLLDEEADAVTADTRALTPMYASPEQLLGGRVSTATDVFQLGTLLCQVVTGSPPFPQATLAEAISRAAHDGSPALSPEASSRLDADLEAIILKCLATDPESRYPDVNAFNEDLGRYLEGYPISARRPRWWTPALKLVQRNAWISSAVGLLLLTLLAGNFFYLAALERSRAEAQNEADRATAVTEFLVGLFNASDPQYSTGDTLTANDILTAGATRIENDLTSQPAVRAEIMHTVGRIYTAIGEYEQSEQLLREALQIRESLYGEQHASLADSHAALAWLLYGVKEDDEAALEHFERALDIHLNTRGADPAYALLLARMANLEIHARERYEVALTLLEEAHAIQERFLEADDSDRAAVLSLFMTAHARLGDYTRAERYGREALRLAEAAFGPDHARVHGPLFYLARVLESQGRYLEAIDLMERDLVIVENVFGRNHFQTGDTYLNLSHLYRMSGRIDDAVHAGELSVELLGNAYGTDHSNYATALAVLSAAYQEVDRMNAAERLLTQAVDIYERRAGPDHTHTAYGITMYGDFLIRTRRYTSAAEQYHRAHAIWRGVVGDDHPDSAKMVMRLGEIALLQDDLEKADELLGRALAVNEAHLPPDHLRIADNLALLGQLRIAEHRSADCRPPLERALNIRAASLPGDHPDLIRLRSDLDTCAGLGASSD